MPVDAYPATVVHEMFLSPVLAGAAPARITSTGGWIVTEVGGGAVTVLDSHGGGVNLAANAQNDEASIAMGQSHPIELEDLPHASFGIDLQQLDTNFYAEFGFRDTAATTYAKVVYEATEWRFKTSNGGAATSTALSETPDTSYHLFQLRISDDGVLTDGSRVEVAVDGTLDSTFDKTGDANYPDLTDNLHAFYYIKNNKAGGGAYAMHVHHFGLVMKMIMA
jgi:hypothetical protein